MSELDQVEQIIATTLGMEVRHFRMRTKKVPVVELRFIGAMVIRILYSKKVSYRYLGERWGYQHDRIIYMENRAKELLEIQDPQFTGKWIKVTEALMKYLGKSYCRVLYIPEENKQQKVMSNESIIVN